MWRVTVWWIHAHRWHARHPVWRAIWRIVTHGRGTIGHHCALRQLRHGVAIASSTSLAVLWSVSWVFTKIPSSIATWRGPLGKRIWAIGCKRVLLVAVAIELIVSMKSIGYQLTGRRSGTTTKLMEARVRHHARCIAVGSVLRYMTPPWTWMVGGNRCATARGCVARIIVLVVQAVLVGGLGPARPPRPTVFAIQRGSAWAPVA
jgi:hypothetical protein